ncbi:hypothetical protein L7F22_031345 [Adiantum nelumboides]|nr:hypothetical protein [Adiantum nelumboides]
METKEKHEPKGKNHPQNSSKGNSSNNKAKEKGVYKGKNRLTPEELECYHKDNRCFKCKEQGHSYRTCPQRNARNEQPRASIIEAPKEDVHCKGTPLSYAWGKVRDNDVFILFDPSSTHTFISHELATKLGIQEFEMGDAMKANGAFIGQDASVTPLIGKLRLHIQGYVDKEDLFISPLKHEDVILGAPWFDRLAASIKFPPRKISFKFREKDMYIVAQKSGFLVNFWLEIAELICILVLDWLADLYSGFDYRLLRSAVQVQVYWSAVQDYWLLDWSGQQFRVRSGSGFVFSSGLVSRGQQFRFRFIGQQFKITGYWTGLVSLWLLVSSVTGLVSAGSGLWFSSPDMATSNASSSISIEERYPFSLSQLCRLCYPVISLEWNHIEQLPREKNLDELEWLICLLTTSDPYPVEDMHPIAQIYPLAQVDYTRLVRFLVLLCEKDDEDIEYDWTDMSHGMTDNDFIYLDDEDRGLALGLPPNLFNILFS